MHSTFTLPTTKCLIIWAVHMDLFSAAGDQTAYKKRETYTFCFDLKHLLDTDWYLAAFGYKLSLVKPSWKLWEKNVKIDHWEMYIHFLELWHVSQSSFMPAYTFTFTRLLLLFILQEIGCSVWFPTISKTDELKNSFISTTYLDFIMTEVVSLETKSRKHWTSFRTSWACLLAPRVRSLWSFYSHGNEAWTGQSIGSFPDISEL